MKPRVLVIDDEPRMAEIVAMVLRRDGLDLGHVPLVREDEDPRCHQ